jgi:SNF2 family DNA or RNA helicase
MSRIAMTGSPLSNNLMEYWAMIDWIHPGYLGPESEFRRKYVGPIEDGLYVDSSQAEKRRSLTMLKVLKMDLSLKIHRADIDVIKSEMPSKSEFLVTLPLTNLQTEIYNRFVYSMVVPDYR